MSAGSNRQASGADDQPTPSSSTRGSGASYPYQAGPGREASGARPAFALYSRTIWRTRRDCDAHLPVFALEEARAIHRAEASVRRLFYDLFACELVLQSAPRNGERATVFSDVSNRGLKSRR